MKTNFKSTNALYTFTYSLILLNTDLYNKTVKKKITFEEFVNMVKNINDGENLSEDLLRSCYNNVSKAEIKVFTYRDMSYEENLTKGEKKCFIFS